MDTVRKNNEMPNPIKRSLAPVHFVQPALRMGEPGFDMLLLKPTGSQRQGGIAKGLKQSFKLYAPLDKNAASIALSTAPAVASPASSANTRS